MVTDECAINEYLCLQRNTVFKYQFFFKFFFEFDKKIVSLREVINLFFLFFIFCKNLVWFST